MSRSHHRALWLMLTATLTLAFATPALGAQPGSAPESNGRIAFSTGYLGPHPDRETPSQVYTINPDGSDLRQLTHVRKHAQAGDPDWSPDGSQIVYISNASGDYAVWVMDATGKGQHRIAGTPGWEYFTPRWSPDGSRLAVVACDSTLGFELYCDLVLMDKYGNNQRLLVGGHRLNADPDWSPDGRQIAFDSDRAGLVSAVWVVNTKGRPHPRRLTAPSLEAFWPQWAPGESDRILFSSTCCTAATDLFTVRPSDKTVSRLTSSPAGEFAAFGSYSPDGEQIVFVSNHDQPDGNPALFTMNADGSDMTTIMTQHPDVLASDWGTFTTTTHPSATY
jgi:Tol biopolymer transport system component